MSTQHLQAANKRRKNTASNHTLEMNYHELHCLGYIEILESGHVNSKKTQVAQYRFHGNKHYVRAITMVMRYERYVMLFLHLLHELLAIVNVSEVSR